ncbi:MAG: V-type ATPase 116kDa subunit family protein [Spirochaetales bacterium]
MIFTERMHKVELLLLKRDIDQVLEYLGVRKCFQVSDTLEPELGETYYYLQDLLNRLKKGMDFLRISPKPGLNILGTPKQFYTLTPQDFESAENLLNLLGQLINEEKNLLEQKTSLETTLQEIKIFAKMSFPLKELEQVTFLVYRYGSVSPAKLSELEEKLLGRAVIFALDEKGRILVLASKKGRFAMETELKQAEFRDLPLPEAAKDLTPSLLQELEQKLTSVLENLETSKQKREELKRKLEGEFQRLNTLFEVGLRIEELKAHLQHSEQAYVLSGWVPHSLLSGLLIDLENLTEGRIAIRVYNPEEILTVREGIESPPVWLKHGKFLKAFHGIVFSYGAPLYGSIDPTPLVAVFFTLLFAIMFGDLGQGFVILLFGIWLNHTKVPLLQKWNTYALAFKTVGLASMVAGLLYGSCFGSETLLIPISRLLTQLILGEPKDRFISLLPSEGIDRLLTFFGFTVAVGVLINSLGLVINIYNQIRKKDFHKAVFSKTGIVGALFFWYTLALALRVVLLNSHFNSFDGFILTFLLVLLFWGEPLSRLLAKKRPLFPEGFFSFIMEGTVEVLESISYYISNSVSFLRVGAFALSHTVLSLIVFKIAELMHSLPASWLFQFLIIVAGNVLILVLEGLIVTIQVIRLHYYEFFSKFFTETGKPFKPFDLTQA